MLTIYHTNQKAIVANEQTKTYKVMPKSEAAEYSKDKQTSLKPRLDLVNAMEMLLSCGYEEEEE